MIHFELTAVGCLILGDDVDLINRDNKESFDKEDDTVIKDCKNKFYFDSEYLLIGSHHRDGTDLATIMFPLSKRFIENLKSMISCIESNGYEDGRSGDWVDK